MKLRFEIDVNAIILNFHQNIFFRVHLDNDFLFDARVRLWNENKCHINIFRWDDKYRYFKRFLHDAEWENNSSNLNDYNIFHCMKNMICEWEKSNLAVRK